MDQDVCLFSRNRMELTGIEEVESYSGTEILLRSSLGSLAVTGNGLKIGQFSAETGKLSLTGEVDGIQYYGGAEEGDGGRCGFFGKLFR